VRQVGLGVGGLGMDLGMRSHLDVKRRARLGPDERDEVVRVAELSRRRRRAGWRITTDHHQVADAEGAIA
jgi:hypothetical protein